MEGPLPGKTVQGVADALASGEMMLADVLSMSSFGPDIPLSTFTSRTLER